MTIWFTADTHFGHRNILKYTGRKFATVEDMDAQLIENWNARIQLNDTVYHLGDFALRQNTPQIATLFAQLHGKKHLIIGNHDDKYVLRLPWHSQAAYADIKIDNTHVVLFHYAIVGWNRQRYGTIHLHGHHHGTLSAVPSRIDVGVDAWNMFPVSWETIKVKASIDGGPQLNSQ